jgi:hypothetical protein
MIKALNLQPISVERKMGRPTAKKDGGVSTRAEELEDLKKFSNKLTSMASAQQQPPAAEIARPQEQAAEQKPIAQLVPAPAPMVAPAPVPVPEPAPYVPMQAAAPAPGPIHQPPVLPAAAMAPAAAAPASRTKGVRLKNAPVLRPGQEPKPKPVVEKREDDAPQESAPSQPAEDPRTRQQKAQWQNVVLLGRTQGFSRTVMLQFGKLCKTIPSESFGYKTASRDDNAQSPGNWERYPRKDRGVADNSPASWRTGMGGKSSKDKKGGKEKDSLRPSANAYQIRKATTREAELERDTRSLLNKICPENKDRIIERIAQTEIQGVAEMEVVVDIIFKKVTDDEHYCATYVDMIHALHEKYPDFPPAEEGGPRQSFRRMLVNTCQDKFESLTSEPELPDAVKEMGPEELAAWEKKQKKKALATMKFIGHLFLRQLLAAAVIRQVIGDLLNGEPPEIQVEYALELLQAVGHQFENSEKDKAQLSIILDRLSSLKIMKGADGKPYLSKRVQFLITDIEDLRRNGWKGKGFKEVAKKLDSVREEQEKDEQMQGTTKGGGKGGGGYHGGGGGGGRRH